MTNTISLTCPYREGKRVCIWYVTGCINRNVPLAVKQTCNQAWGKLARGPFPREVKP